MSAAEVSDTELAAIRAHGYVLQVARDVPPDVLPRQDALAVFGRVVCSPSASVVSMSFGRLIHDDPRAVEPSFGSTVSHLLVWLAVSTNERTPVLGGRPGRHGNLPTSVLEDRWAAIDVHDGHLLISCSLAR